MPVPVVSGRLVSVEGGATVEAVLVETAAGVERFPCSAVFLDYHAFEVQPALSVDGLADLGVATTADGFIEIDAWGATQAPGVFAGGDVTGRYASTLSALGDGVNAGFSALRHAYRAKFGTEPDLFAYRGLEQPVPVRSSAPPVFPEDSVPVLIGRPERARQCFARVLEPALALALTEHLGRDLELTAIGRALHLSPDVLSAAVRAGIHGRELALHRAPPSPVLAPDSVIPRRGARG
jgi:hypothetical protein